MITIIRAAAVAATLALVGAAAAQGQEYPASLGTWQDRALIEQTLQRYVAGFDQNDPALFASAFAEDGVFEYNDDVYSGRDAIAGFIEQRNVGRTDREASGASDSSARLYHVMTNSLIMFEDDTHATHTAYGMTIGRTTEETHISSSGSYTDQLVKEDGGWLIQHRHLDQLPVFTPPAATDAPAAQ